MSYPQRIPDDRTIIDPDPVSRVDELLTRLRQFRRVRKDIGMDISMLSYCFSDRTPDDEGIYVQPPMRYKSTEGLSAFPIHRRMVGGDLQCAQYQFTNDGVNSGNHSMKIEPDATSPVELLAWFIYNGDAAPRNATLHVAGTAGTILGYLFPSTAVAATSYDSWPNEGLAIAKGYVLNGNQQEIVSTLASLAVSKVSRQTMVYRVMGDTDPTITTTGPTGCTIVGIT